MPLRRVDLGEGHRGKRRGRAGRDGATPPTARMRSAASGRFKPRSTTLARRSRARPKSPRERCLVALIGRAAQEQLVDELGARQDARPGDARPLGSRDESLAVQPFELDTVHATVMSQRRRRCKGDGLRVYRSRWGRATRASATSRPI